MRISVIGTGYVGLVTGACLADSGHSVCCVDIDEAKIAKLNDGIIPIYEPGLEDLVERNTRENRLSFSSNVTEAIESGAILFIAVGTPPGPDGAADLSHVFNVVRTISATATSPKIIVTKSTVPIGTGEKIREILDTNGIRHEVVSNPEFLKEGAAISDFTNPDRIVIGTNSAQAMKTMKRLYQPIVDAAPSRRASVIEMDIASAEMTKYAANAMLATRISFMNELARLCGKVGADVKLVQNGIGLDPRIGQRFLNPGIGYGGSCFPKDVQAMIATGREHDSPFQILEAVHAVNERQKSVLVELITSYYGDDLSNHTFAVWGLAFKPNTDDMREAPSIVIIEALLSHGARIVAFDPVAQANAESIWGDRISYTNLNKDALKGADALLVLTEWKEFRVPNLARMKDELGAAVVFDGRNIYDPDVMRKAGFTYFSIGRPPVLADTDA
ncbi:MAG: UDP-glucose 6-dehydrogenase [Myxococcales bacterium]|nr:UDP-glucose 6-dehydrogenase [Myxococcales bacterium]